MSVAILYRWRVDPLKETAFEDAWGEGTRLIHERCGSFGARLHKGADGLYWSYALWPDDATRKRCFADAAIKDHDSFRRMRAAIREYFPEIPLDPRIDVLEPMRP